MRLGDSVNAENKALKEVIYLTTNTAILIVAIIAAAIAFATLILKIVEVARK
jgi:hypothetical protein